MCIPLGLLHGRVDGDGGEVAVVQELGELRGAGDALDKNDALVELEGVEEVDELAVLLLLLKLDVVLLQTVEGELGAVVDVDLQRLEKGSG